MKHDLAFVAIILIALALLVSCGSDEAAETGGGTSASALSSSISFTAIDVDGNQRSSTEWIGRQPVVINIWGTWCPPCRREIPDLVRLYNEYKPRGVEMIGFALERRAGPADVKAFAAQNGMEWVMLMADQQIATLFNARSVPMTIFVDRNGKVVDLSDLSGRSNSAFIGPQPYGVFKKAFEKLLEG